MVKLSNILDGWGNFIERSEVTEQLAVERAKECSICPFAKQTKLLAFLNDDIKEIQGAYCSKCKCPLSAKIRTELESCPLGKW